MPLMDQGKCATGTIKKLQVHISTTTIPIKEFQSKTDLFESSRIPASALYQAKNAASSAKKPPAFSTGVFTMPAASGCKYAIPRSMKAISREKNRLKKATVERSVASRSRKVNMNQPYARYYLAVEAKSAR